MTSNQFTALLGYAFALTWITVGLGDAVICLVVALACAAAAAVWRGELDITELRERLAQPPSR